MLLHLVRDASMCGWQVFGVLSPYKTYNFVLVFGLNMCMHEEEIVGHF